MKKVKKDGLHSLIQSLNSAERGYFSKYAQRHVVGETNNYEVLFQLLVQMTTYDAEILEKGLRENGVQTPLTAAKSHLKSILLRAMRAYNSHESAQKKLLNGLADLEFLAEKKHYVFLRKEIKRLKKIAIDYEAHHVLFKIGAFERRLHKETAGKDVIQGMEEILKEMNAYAVAFQKELAMSHLMDKVFVIAKKSGANQLSDLEGLLESEVMEKQANESLMTQIYRQQIKAIESMLKGQLEVASQYYEDVMALWKTKPHLISEHATTYRRVLGNYLGISGQIGHFERFSEIIGALRNSPVVQPADEVEIFHISSMAELTWRMGIFDWKQVKPLLARIDQGLEKHAGHLGKASILALRYNGAVFYFLKGELSACLKWLRAITQISSTEQRMDVQRVARLMSLLVIWKRRDLELLEYEYRAATRFFKRLGTGHIEAEGLRFVNELIKAASEQAVLRAFKSFANILAKQDHQQHFAVLMLRAWCDAEMEKKSGLEILQERY